MLSCLIFQSMPSSVTTIIWLVEKNYSQYHIMSLPSFPTSSYHVIWLLIQHATNKMNVRTNKSMQQLARSPSEKGIHNYNWNLVCDCTIVSPLLDFQFCFILMYSTTHGHVDAVADHVNRNHAQQRMPLHMGLSCACQYMLQSLPERLLVVMGNNRQATLICIVM